MSTSHPCTLRGELIGEERKLAAALTATDTL
jgi:hypothetical protein